MNPDTGPAIDPVSYLLHLADAAVAGRPVAVPVAAWLVAGVRAYLDAGGTLDGCLGLRRPGWSAPTVHRRRERDRHLRSAFGLVGGDLCALARALGRFESGPWLRWRGMDRPPPSASPVQVELFAAFASGAPIPQSARQLRRIVVGGE